MCLCQDTTAFIRQWDVFICGTENECLFVPDHRVRNALHRGGGAIGAVQELLFLGDGWGDRFTAELRFAPVSAQYRFPLLFSLSFISSF